MSEETEPSLEVQAIEATGQPDPSIRMIPVTQDGRYLLITQGLPDAQVGELISGLKKWAKNPTANFFVINFAPGVQWQLFAVDEQGEPLAAPKKPETPPPAPEPVRKKRPIQLSKSDLARFSRKLH